MQAGGGDCDGGVSIEGGRKLGAGVNGSITEFWAVHVKRGESWEREARGWIF